MVMQINIGDHLSSEPGYIAFPPNRLAAIRWARQRAFRIAREIPGANVYFRGLPRGQSLSQLLADSSIWINYHATSNAFGLTNVAGGREVAISERAFKRGRWTVLATLVHELAHVDGVRGRIAPQAAERAVLACGMGRNSEATTGIDDPSTPYDPTISG